MNLFIIGDVHGCFYTLQELLQYWQPQEEILIQLGDLVDRGNFAPEAVSLALQLNETYPRQTIFLRGNHEVGMLDHYGPDGPYPQWFNWGGRTTLQQYLVQPALLQPHLRWLDKRPLFWENDYLVVSHAGIADTPDPYDENHPDGMLWRRGPLRNIGKLQVVGHTPTEDGRPYFDPVSSTLYIDTGAYKGRALTGVKISEQGELLDTISVPTHPGDIAR